MAESAVDHEARRQIAELSATMTAMKEAMQALAASQNALAERVTRGEVADAKHSTRLAIIGAAAATMFSALGGLVVWLIGKAFGGGP